MKGISLLALTLAFALPATGSAEESFLTHPELMRSDERFAGDQVYFVDDVLERLSAYQRVMVDEPVIFLAPDSSYGGIKGSDLAALSDQMRRSFIAGLTAEPTSFGNFQAADQAGPGTLFVRIALKNVYVRKNKRGLLAYTPVGAVAKGATDLAKDAIEKSTLVEMTLEAEMQDSSTGEVLFALVMDRGQRADKAAKLKEEAVNWEATGEVAEQLGRRLACRLDNARLPEAQRRDCVAAIPILQ